MAVAVEIFKLVLAGMAGGAVVPYLTHLKERRAARAAVREKLADVEIARWLYVDDDESDRPRFGAAVAAFEAHAMIAGLPREPVNVYVRLAAVGYDSCRRSMEMPGYDPKVGPNIVYKLDKIIGSSRDLLVDILWHPVRTRQAWKKRTQHITAQVERMREVGRHPDVDWHPWDSRSIWMSPEDREREARLAAEADATAGHNSSAAQVEGGRPG